MSELHKDTLYDTLRFFVLCGIVASIVFSLLAINSLFITALVILWLVNGGFRKKWALLSRDKLFLAYALLFAVNTIGILYAPDKLAGWKNTESKLGLIILPLIFCSSPFINNKTRNRTFLVYSVALTIGCLYCLGVAGWRYSTTHHPGVFFYHSLVGPLKHHAVYFSVFTFISLAFLLFEGYAIPWLMARKWLYITWVLFLLAFIILLSSKMALVVLLIFFAYYIMHHYARNHTKKMVALVLVGIAVLVSLFTFDTPVKRRFKDMADSDMSFLSKERFTPNDYFNGFKFRLLLWRFTYEIIQERDAWLLGVSPAEAQPALRAKYTSMNMYPGDKATNDPGYLDYNCHNQLLQSTLQSGLLGLASFLCWCVALAIQTFRKRSILLDSIVLLIFCFFFTDSVFERQYGMVLCTFFPLLLLYSDPAPDRKV